MRTRCTRADQDARRAALVARLATGEWITAAEVRAEYGISETPARRLLHQAQELHYQRTLARVRLEGALGRVVIHRLAS